MSYFEKRFRVFAGPNGSGKSSIIHDIQEMSVEGRKIDFGKYVNADRIARELADASFSFKEYDLAVSQDEFLQFARSSGLLETDASFAIFSNSFTWDNGPVGILLPITIERIAQILALFIVDCFLSLGRKLTFETVFSHASKVSLLEFAKNKGYKVYLYFICTSDPEINVMRVANRVIEGGHNVPLERIRDRYWRSLVNLESACAYAYQAFFFDNSGYIGTYEMVGHFKVIAGERKWDPMPTSEIPEWFLVNCIEKFPEAEKAIRRA